MELKKVTPVAVVDEIEPSLEFWVDRLGFERVVEVPRGDRLGSVLLRRGGSEVVLQTREAVESDLEILADAPSRCTCVLYLEVDSIESITMALAGFEVVVGERKTLDGSREIYYREPGGHIVGFAASGSIAPPVTALS
jgi:catechol 2,3-dioxygenase-like lactoylglutathione lyase family enzyme